MDCKGGEGTNSRLEPELFGVKCLFMVVGGMLGSFFSPPWDWRHQSEAGDGDLGKMKLIPDA